MRALQPVSCLHQGVSLVGEMAVPAGEGPHPAVLVMHDAHGLGDLNRETARRLATQGYVALAADMYGMGKYYSDVESISAVISPLFQAPELLRARVVAWYDVLKARPEVDATRVAAIGYCFGGQCVLELARSGADVKAVVSYHGLLTTTLPAKPGEVSALVAIYAGAKDPYAPTEHLNALRAEMHAARARWHITEFGDAYHAFTDPGATASSGEVPGRAYNPLADKVSWAGTLALLGSILKT